MSVRDTSGEAYEDHREEGKLGDQQHRLMIWFHGKREGFTRSEISRDTGMRLSSVCGRVNELIDLKYLEDAPRRRCTVTGKSAHVVRIAARQLELLAA